MIKIKSKQDRIWDLIGWGIVITTLLWSFWLSTEVERKFTALINLKKHLASSFRDSDSWLVKSVSGILLAEIVFVWMLFPIFLAAFFIFVYHTRKEKLSRRILLIVKDFVKIIAIPLEIPLLIILILPIAIILALIRFGIYVWFFGSVIYFVIIIIFAVLFYLFKKFKRRRKISEK